MKYLGTFIAVTATSLIFFGCLPKKTNHPEEIISCDFQKNYSECETIPSKLESRCELNPSKLNQHPKTKKPTEKNSLKLSKDSKENNKFNTLSLNFGVISPGSLNSSERLLRRKASKKTLQECINEDFFKRSYVDNYPSHNSESYEGITDNPFLNPWENPLSTFSIDVDTASYSNVRRFLLSDQQPPQDSVRIEEMINYFDYGYKSPEENSEHPVNIFFECSPCPWEEKNLLLKVALKAKEIKSQDRGPANLVFLIDVSGSMNSANKLPLLKNSFQEMLYNLNEDDTISIVVYAGSSGCVLPPTALSDKEKIFNALENLRSGGSTNGGEGIQLAYKLATENFIKNGINRVILATDGDFNVGVTNRNQLTTLIQNKAKTGVFLTVLGFGMGNYKDATLEKLADKGNGNYAYIDTLNEAQKVLGENILSTLVTVAKDVKFQLEFNPGVVAGYRLIGYENRVMASEDFNDDTKDAGDVGAGHQVTALYEIVPSGQVIPSNRNIDDLKYQRIHKKQSKTIPQIIENDEMLTLKLRYKNPNKSISQLIQQSYNHSKSNSENISNSFKFSTAIAGFGMILRQSPYRGTCDFDQIISLAEDSFSNDLHSLEKNRRREFISLVRRAHNLSKTRSVHCLVNQ